MKSERKRQTLIGEVISTKMQNTVAVKVTRKIPHPVYHKRVKKFKNYSNKGFALVYDDKFFKNKIINKKLDNRSLQIFNNNFIHFFKYL